MLVRKEPNEVDNYDITKINMRQNPSNAEWEMYELKIIIFEHGQPEEFLQLVKNFKRAVDGTGTKMAAGKINYLRTLLCG